MKKVESGYCRICHQEKKICFEFSSPDEEGITWVCEPCMREMVAKFGLSKPMLSSECIAEMSDEELREEVSYLRDNLLGEALWNMDDIKNSIKELNEELLTRAIRAGKEKPMTGMM